MESIKILQKLEKIFIIAAFFFLYFFHLINQENIWEIVTSIEEVLSNIKKYQYEKETSSVMAIFNHSSFWIIDMGYYV